LHNPENYVIAPGWRIDRDGQEGQVQWRYFESREEAETDPWFRIPDDCWAIVAHNMQYECHAFLCRYRTEFEKFLKRGGRVLCTQQAHYLLSHQTELYPSLNEIAPLYGGTHKVDGVKILWEQGALTSEIDRDLLLQYLTGPEGDVCNTATVFYGEVVKLQEQGMWQMFLERCDALLAYSYCEFFGLQIDTAVAYKNLAEQEKLIAQYKEKLSGLFPENMPEECEFSWTSDYHVSALLYGGPIKYRIRVPYDPPRFEKADCYQLTDGQYIPVDDWKEWAVLNDDYLVQSGVAIVNYASGKNKGLPKVFKVDTVDEKLKWGEALFQMPGLVNLTQMPKEIRERFLGKRAEFQGSRMLADGVTPVYSSSGDALACIAHHCEQVRMLTELAKLEKDTGAFYLRQEYDKEGNVRKTSGLLQYVEPSGIVHHNLNATATVTTRLSSSNPNLQQLPRGDEEREDRFSSRVKEMFVSRFPDGYVIEVDYSALEVVMNAGLTKDKNLMQRLLDKTDMHCYRLAYKLGEPYADVLRKCKDESHPEHAKYKKMRTDIKPPSFAAQYGASAEGIAFATGCTVEFAEEFLANEARMFPESIGFRGIIREAVERTGNQPIGIHREMDDSGSWSVYRRGYWQAPGGTCYSFRQHRKWDRESKQYVLDYKDTQIANYWNQGEAGFLMAISMGRICRWMLEHDWFGGNACLINNVHDAAYADCADLETTRIVGLGIKQIMEDTPKYMTELWPEYDLAGVPFPAAAEYGKNLHNKHHLQ